MVLQSSSGENDLPMTEAPDPELVADQATRAPLAVQLERLREHIGAGMALTAAGIPEPGAARVLTDLLRIDRHRGRSAAGDVPTAIDAEESAHLGFLLRIATVAGALDDDGTILSPSAGWGSVSPVERCGRLLDAALGIGVASRGMRSGRADGRPGVAAEAGMAAEAEVLDEMGRVLDDGGVYLLLPAFIAGEEYVASAVDRAIGVVHSQLGDRWPQFFEGDTVDESVERAMNRVFETFERLGIVELCDRVERADAHGGTAYRTGGSVRITDLGRHLLEVRLSDLGHVVHHPSDLATVDAAEAVIALATSEIDPSVIWHDWRPEADPVHKFDDLMEVLATASTGPERLAAVALMEQAPERVKRRIEAMVDGPRAAYALMVLDPDRSPFAVAGTGAGGVTSGDASPAGHGRSVRLSDGRPVERVVHELGPARSLAPMVDLLWLEMDTDPRDLIEHVVLLDAGAPAVGLDPGAFTRLLEDLWRVDLPETVDLLEFLGANHPVEATAGLAREGLVKHRRTHPGR